MTEPNQGRVSRAVHRRSGRRSRIGACLLAFLTASAALAPTMVRAQEGARPALNDDQKAKTKEHFEKADRLYNVGKYQEAIQEYEAAYLISADPVALYNIAQCHRLNDQPEEAVRFYKNYLRNAPNASATIRAGVEKKIAEMEKRAEDKRRGAPPPAGTAPPPVGTAPPPVTTPTPTPPPVVPPPSPSGPIVTPPPGGNTPSVDVSQSGSTEGSDKPSRVLPITLMVGGGALIATSVVLGALAAAKAKDVEELAQRKNVVFTGDAKQLETDGKALSGGAVLTGLVGVAAGVTGVVLLLRSGGSRAPQATPAQALIYPVAGPGLAGAGARFTF